VLTGFLVSVAVHLALLVPLLVMMMTAHARRPPLQARFNPEHFRPETEDPDEPPEQPLPLGIDEGSPSSMTWIGYDTYQEHIARLADFEQAEFTDAEIPPDQVSGAQPAPAVAEGADAAAESIASEALSAPQPTEASEQPESDPESDATEASEQPESDPEPDAPESAAAGVPDDDATAGEPAPLELAPGEVGAEALDPAALTPSAADGEPLVPEADAPEIGEPSAGAAEAEDESTASPDPSPLAASLVRRMLAQLQRAPAPAEPEAAATPAPDSTETPAVAQTTPPPEVAQPGQPADRDSDATSVEVPIDTIKAGRPLAARGLELLPKRPDFTMVVSLTASPCNPLVAMHFQRNGRPYLAEILETSCDKRVDDAVLSSLYRWRAKGKPLESLGPTDSYEVRIRIVLSRR
jgi:hypothetical protein